MSGRVRLGTSSWSSPDWVGPFYPEGTRPPEFLTEYAKHFDCVETDSTYYGVPTLAMAKAWAERTPEGFLMAAKFPRSICHGGEGAKPDPECLLDLDRTARERDAFLTAMLELGDRCGPLLLQFPYFNKGVFPHPGPFLSKLDQFLSALPPDFRYAVETRNRNFLRPDFLEILRRHSASLVLVDQGWMPHADELPKRLDPVTSDFTYIRLLGNRKEIEKLTTTWGREVLDQEDRIDRWARVILTLRERVPETFAFANNHYAGHGPATVRRLAERIALRSRE